MKLSSLLPAKNSLERKKITVQDVRTTFALIALAATFVIAMILRGYTWITSFTHPSTATVAAQIDPRAQLVARVSQHLQLPATTPTIEQVEDIETMRRINPDFYQDLQSGDWILRYPSELIVYRASEDRIIRVAPAE